MKDWALTQLANMLAPAAFRRWGIADAIRGFRVVRFDSAARCVEIEIRLKGEERNLQLRIARYTVTDRGGRAYLRLDRVDCDRPWISMLLDRLASGRELELPPWARFLLSNSQTERHEDRTGPQIEDPDRQRNSER